MPGAGSMETDGSTPRSMSRSLAERGTPGLFSYSLRFISRISRAPSGSRRGGGTRRSLLIILSGDGGCQPFEQLLKGEIIQPAGVIPE